MSVPLARENLRGLRGNLKHKIRAIDNKETDFEMDPVNTANVVPCQE